MFVNSPALPGFTAVNNGDSIAVGGLAQTGAAGPFTEHNNQLELRIGNAVTATADLNLGVITFTPVSGYGLGTATLSAGFVNPIGAGASQDRFIQNITDQLIPVAFQLDVSIPSDDPDENPFNFTITGVFNP